MYTYYGQIWKIFLPQSFFNPDFMCPMFSLVYDLIWTNQVQKLNIKKTAIMILNSQAMSDK